MAPVAQRRALGALFLLLGLGLAGVATAAGLAARTTPGLWVIAVAAAALALWLLALSLRALRAR